MQPFPSRGAGLAESIESGQGAFATTTFGQLRTTSACSEPGRRGREFRLAFRGAKQVRLLQLW